MCISISLFTQFFSTAALQKILPEGDSGHSLEKYKIASLQGPLGGQEFLFCLYFVLTNIFTHAILDKPKVKHFQLHFM